MEDEHLNAILEDPKVQEELNNSFFEHLKKILLFWKKNPDSSLEAQMDAVTSDEEAKRVMKELCEENDMYYENLRDLQKAKKEDESLTNGDWLVREMDKEAQALTHDLEGRDATSEEMKEFHQKVKQGLDEEIENESRELGQIVTAIDGELQSDIKKEEQRWIR